MKILGTPLDDLAPTGENPWRRPCKASGILYIRPWVSICILLGRDGATGGAGVQLHPQPRAKTKLKRHLCLFSFVKWALSQK